MLPYSIYNLDMRLFVFFIAVILILSLMGCETASPYEDAVLVDAPVATQENNTLEVPTPTLEPTDNTVGTPAMTQTPTAEPTLKETIEPTPSPTAPPTGEAEPTIGDETDGTTPVPTATPLPSPTPSSIPEKVILSDLDEYDLGAANYSGEDEQLFYMSRHLGSSKVGVMEAVCRILSMQERYDGSLSVLVDTLDYYMGDIALEMLLVDNPGASDEQKENAFFYGYGIRRDDMHRLLVSTVDTRYFIRSETNTLAEVDYDEYMKIALPAFSDDADNPFDYVIIGAIDREIVRIETVLNH